MQRIAVFETVSRQTEPEPRIELRRADTGTTIALDAATLIAQYRTGPGDILLVLDEDVPYEEQLHLALVRGSEVVDHIVIGAPYATGVYKEISVEGDRLRFTFTGDPVLTLTVRDAASRMPERLPPGARRRSGWFAKHHLSLSEGRDR